MRASHIIRYYVFTCTVVMVAPTRRMPHTACHMLHGSFSPRPTFSLLAEEKSKKVNKQNEQMEWRGKQEFPGISQAREKKRETAQEMAMVWSVRRNRNPSSLYKFNFNLWPFKCSAQLLLLSQLHSCPRGIDSIRAGIHWNRKCGHWLNAVKVVTQLLNSDTVLSIDRYSCWDKDR